MSSVASGNNKRFEDNSKTKGKCETVNEVPEEVRVRQWGIVRSKASQIKYHLN